MMIQMISDLEKQFLTEFHGDSENNIRVYTSD